MALGALGLEQPAASDGTLVAIANPRMLSWAGDEVRASTEPEPDVALIYASIDGATWSEVLSEPGVTLTAVAAGNGHFAALGWRADPAGPSWVLYVSEDAQMWMDVALPGPGVDTLVFGNGTFMASDTLGEAGGQTV